MPRVFSRLSSMLSALSEHFGVRPIRVETRKELHEAAKDFYYLLNRGYRRQPALDLVTSRYSLSKLERLCLYRCIFQEAVNMERRRKLITPSLLREHDMLVVDAFNQVSTVASALAGDTLVLSTDGFVRDLAATNRRIVFSPLYVSALYILVRYLARVFGKLTVFVFDSQVSWSQHFAVTAEQLCRHQGLECTTLLSPKADSAVIEASRRTAPVSTSDSVIIDRVNLLFDAGGELGKIISPCSILELKVL